LSYGREPSIVDQLTDKPKPGFATVPRRPLRTRASAARASYATSAGPDSRWPRPRDVLRGPSRADSVRLRRKPPRCRRR